MMKKTYVKPQDERDDVQQPYFDHEDPKADRRKIKKEDLDTLEAWDDRE
ncbi:MAG: hypothetical protein IJP27_05120 [Clostridia bacterium]|nr:hypothetical protein [Bacillota bacterium]MBQ6824011.1 hypothetical protein [Clostridia bacterium]